RGGGGLNHRQQLGALPLEAGRGVAHRTEGREHQHRGDEREHEAAGAERDEPVPQPASAAGDGHSGRSSRHSNVQLTRSRDPAMPTSATSCHGWASVPLRNSPWSSEMPWVTGSRYAATWTAGWNSSMWRTKPLKNMEARSVSSASWTAWR